MQQPPTLNALKFQYRKENIITMEDLLSILNVSPSVTVHEASADDFFDYDKLFSLYYADFRSKIKQNHIFACANEMSGNQLLVRLRESNLEEHPVTTHKVIKKGFYGCKNYATLMEAVNNRQKDMKALTKDLLENIVSEGLNAYKQVEMHAPAVANAAVAFSASAVVAVATAATAATVPSLLQLPPQLPPPQPWLIVMFSSPPRSISMVPVVGGITHDPIKVRR